MNVIFLLIGAVLSVLFIAVYFANAKKYQPMVDAADPTVFMMKDIYIVGMALIQALKIDSKKIMGMKKRRSLAELYTEQYVDFYSYVSVASTISFLLLFFAMAFLFGALANSAVILVLFMLIALLMPVLINSRVENKIKERRDELLLDYPTVLSKMALMINAGMMLRDAWTTVANSGTRTLYTEMKRAAVNIANGESEISAYEAFGSACKINELKKFASIICQNVEKGNSELVHVMKELSVEAWNTKKNVAVAKGKNAETMLIIPVGITFVAILAMVLIPIMSNMNM